MDKNLDQTKGKIKQAVGDLTDNRDLQREGRVDENAGKAKEFAKDAKNKVDDVIDNVKDRMHRDQ